MRGRRRTIALAAALAGGLAAAGCGAPPPAASLLELSGEAFGTTWRVRLPQDAPAPPLPALASALARELGAVDRALSTWRDDSELARFNARRDTAWMPVSRRTAEVTAEALAVHARSGGALDPTVGPLLALWGFGPRPAPSAAPDAAALRRARARTGAAHLEVRLDPPALRKRRPELALELSALGEGHAADALAAHLEARGVPRFLVDVGGELRAGGAGPDGGPWKVGVEHPAAGRRRVDAVVTLRDAALATSGTWRRVRAVGGRTRPHVLDPRRGRPVAHALRAVSVRAPRAATADAWATALLVLGPEEGPRVARREGLAALFVVERAGALEIRGTPALAPHRLDAGDAPRAAGAGTLFAATFAVLVVAFAALGLGALAGRAPLRRGCGTEAAAACEACPRPCPRRRGRGEEGP